MELQAKMKLLIRPSGKNGIKSKGTWRECTLGSHPLSATDWLIYLLHIFYDIMHIIKSLTDKRGTS